MFIPSYSQAFHEIQPLSPTQASKGSVSFAEEPSLDEIMADPIFHSLLESDHLTMRDIKDLVEDYHNFA